MELSIDINGYGLMDVSKIVSNHIEKNIRKI